MKDYSDIILTTLISFLTGGLDSIQIITYKEIDKDETPIDTSSIFIGTYMLSSNDSILTLRGNKNDTLMKAVYKKLPIDGHDWWW